MKRCKHDWSPLITATPPTGHADRILFALSLGGLGNYDRCMLCGRLSWITRRRRILVSCDTAEIERKAAAFDAWVSRQSHDSHDIRQ